MEMKIKIRWKYTFCGKKSTSILFFLWKLRWWICKCKLKLQNLYSSWIWVARFLQICLQNASNWQTLVSTFRIFQWGWGGGGGGGGGRVGSMPSDPPRNFLFYFISKSRLCSLSEVNLRGCLSVFVHHWVHVPWSCMMACVPRAISVGVLHSWQVQPSWTGLCGRGQTRVCSHANPWSRKMLAFLRNVKHASTHYDNMVGLSFCLFMFRLLIQSLSVVNLRGCLSVFFVCSCLNFSCTVCGEFKGVFVFLSVHV